jgi:hypothetical protein
MEYLRVDGLPTLINYQAPENTTNVVYSVYDLVNNEYLQYDEVSDHEDSIFVITLSPSVSKYDRSLKIEIQSIQTDNYSEDELYITLVRPLATVAEINEYFSINFSSTESILENSSSDFVKKLERKARYFINAYTGNDFKFEYKTVGAYGLNTDLLHLGQKIESFDKITYDDYVIYDSTEDPAIDLLDVTLAVAPSKFSIKVVAEGVNITEWVDQNPLQNPSYFGKDSAYLVRGEYGWKKIPEDIKIALYELINHFLCNDYIYRNKGMKSVQNDSFNIQFADGMLNGTGNLYVDSLLSQYKVWNLKAI